MKKIYFVSVLLYLIISFTACNSKPGTASQETNTSQAIHFDIVAESGNSISSADKEKVIKKLDDELGTLFDSINDMKDK